MQLSLYPILLQATLIRWRVAHAVTVLRRRQRLVLAGIALGLAGAWCLNGWLPERWQSTAVIHLDPMVSRALERGLNDYSPTPGVY